MQNRVPTKDNLPSHRITSSNIHHASDYGLLQCSQHLVAECECFGDVWNKVVLEYRCPSEEDTHAKRRQTQQREDCSTK